MIGYENYTDPELSPPEELTTEELEEEERLQDEAVEADIDRVRERGVV